MLSSINRRLRTQAIIGVRDEVEEAERERPRGKVVDSEDGWDLEGG